MTESTWVVEKSYEATTLDYLSPLWYEIGRYEGPGAEAEASEHESVAEGEYRAQTNEPCAFRVREIKAQSPTYLDDLDAHYNRQYWAGQAREAERVQQGRRELWALKGQQVVVTGGRKIPVGTAGECFWAGESKYGARVGLKTAEGETVWVDARWVEPAEQKVSA